MVNREIDSNELWKNATKTLIDWRQSAERRGVAARLRRCRKPMEVEFEGAFHALRSELKELERCRLVGENQLALLIGLTSHVRPPDDTSQEDTSQEDTTSRRSMWFPNALGRHENDRPLLSESRFRRLLAIERNDDESEELMMSLIRCVRLLKGRVPIGSLWQDLAYWTPTVRKKWAAAYYKNFTKESQS